MMILLSRSSVSFSVCLGMHQNGSKITKSSWGSMPPIPPTVNDCRAPSLITLSPSSPDIKCYVYIRFCLSPISIKFCYVTVTSYLYNLGTLYTFSIFQVSIACTSCIKLHKKNKQTWYLRCEIILYIQIGKDTFYFVFTSLYAEYFSALEMYIIVFWYTIFPL